MGEHFQDFYQSKSENTLIDFMDILRRGDFASYAEQMQSIMKVSDRSADIKYDQSA